MWKTKTFSTSEKMKVWIAAHWQKYQIEIIFVNNGYGVEYKPMRIIDFVEE